MGPNAEAVVVNAKEVEMSSMEAKLPSRKVKSRKVKVVSPPLKRKECSILHQANGEELLELLLSVILCIISLMVLQSELHFWVQHIGSGLLLDRPFT